MCIRDRPVVIDPSHAAGIAFMVPSLAKAAVAVGADGLMIEVHNDPARAKSCLLYTSRCV